MKKAEWVLLLASVAAPLYAGYCSVNYECAVADAQYDVPALLR